MDQNPQKLKTRERIQRELYRKSHDRLKIYNPLDTPFTIQYDRYLHTAKPKSEYTNDRYIITRMMGKMIDQMIMTDGDMAAKEENDRRMKTGQKKMDPQERELFDSQNNLEITNRERRAKYMKIIYKGVVERYGITNVPEAMRVPDEPTDRRPVDEQLLEELQDAQIDTTPLPIGTNDLDDDDDDIEDKKEELLKGL